MTKPVATATAVMILVERGQLSLQGRVAKYIPEFAQNGKHSVTIEGLLLHTSGMVQSPPSDYTARPRDHPATCICHEARFTTGKHFSYSNLGFIVLSEVVSRISGMPFEEFCMRNIFKPMHMNNSFFKTTLDASHRANLAPQTPDETQAALRKSFGTVPGVNGHAGMSNVGDLTQFVLALYEALDSNRIDFRKNTPVLSERALSAMITPHYVGDAEFRGLGWDIASGFSRNGGDLMPRGRFGHTGSGTSLWMDPATASRSFF